jgi:hypothetical protein
MIAVALGIGLLDKAKAQPRKIPVQVIADCQDSIGAKVVTAFRDSISRSPRYELDSTSPWGVSMACVSSNATSGVSTAASALFVFNNTYISQQISACGSDNVRGCAEGIVSAMDMIFTDYAKSNPLAMKSSERQY